MKKYIIFTTLLTLFSTVSCSSSENSVSNEISSSNVITRDEIQFMDNSRIYKKSELPNPEGINTVIDILYNEAADIVYIFGADIDGNIICCITDSSFSMYKNIELNMRYDVDANSVYAVSSDKIYAVLTNIDHGDDVLTADTDYDEYMRNAVYKYKLNVYDTDCNLLSYDKIEITDELLADSSFRTVTGLKCAKENKLILEVGGAYLHMGSDGNIIDEIDSENVNEFIESSGEYLSYYVQNGGFYGVKSDTVTEKLIDFANSGLFGINMITPIADGDFICCEGNKIFKLSERDESEFSELQEITLAVAGKTDNIQGKVSDFNSQSNLYRITMKNYLDGYEYSIDGLDNAAHDLEIDIITGNIPDMVWIDTNEINKLSLKGAFADLYEFVDDDRKFSRDTFLQNYLEATETNGHLYSITPTFMIETIAAKSKLVSTPNWTFDGFKAFYDSYSDEVKLFEMGNNRDAMLPRLTNNGSEFVDYGTHSCSFNSDDFINILEFSAQFPSVDEYDFEGGSCRNETALMSVLYFGSFRDINVQKQCVFGEDMTFVGFPSESGSGSVMLLSNQFAIMKNSDNKDGAWEVIKSFLSDDNFRQNADGIPVTESGFNIAMDEALEPPYYIDDLTGKKTYMSETGVDSYTNQIIKHISPMTESEQKVYEQFVRSVNRASMFYDSQINRMMDEEAASYFAGECSAQQCADRIQTRVSIMLSEQS